MPTRGFVTTTWHDVETLEDVAFLFLNGAEVDDAPPRHRLGIVVGGGTSDVEKLEDVLRNTQAMELRS